MHPPAEKYFSKNKFNSNQYMCENSLQNQYFQLGYNYSFLYSSNMNNFNVNFTLPNSNTKNYNFFANKGNSLNSASTRERSRTEAMDFEEIKQGLYQSIKANEIKFNFNTFKTNPCTNSLTHNHKHCENYHSFLDKRRNILLYQYSPEKCKYYELNSCPLQDQCSFSHNNVERLYHPLKFKTKFCSSIYQEIIDCEYGPFCGFAHSEQEIRNHLIHKLERDLDFYMFIFKTVFCPFNHEHNKASCVYAHNWQDFRRNPYIFYYSPQACPYWECESFIMNYQDGCKNGADCEYSHGWKEMWYHPFSYKIQPCQTSCSKKAECPYFHSFEDRRDLLYYQYTVPRKREDWKNPNVPILTNPNDIREYVLNFKAQNSLTPNLKINKMLKSENILEKKLLSPSSSIISVKAENKATEPQSNHEKVWEDMATLLGQEHKISPKSSPNSPARQLPIFKKILEKNQINEARNEISSEKEKPFSRTLTEKEIEISINKKSDLTYESEAK